MKRFFLFLHCFLLFSFPSCAEIMCICGQDHCLCFIQYGDEGPAVEAIQNELVRQGFLLASEDSASFDERTRQAVLSFQSRHHLTPNGIMDDETLTLLLWGVLPDVLNQSAPLSIENPVWVPTDGGIRHHRHGECCNMLDPRLISHRNALKMEIFSCGRCDPDGFNTDLLYPLWGR